MNAKIIQFLKCEKQMDVCLERQYCIFIYIFLLGLGKKSVTFLGKNYSIYYM